MAERTVIVDLGDGATMIVEAAQVGIAFVSDEDLRAKFDGVTKSIEQVSRSVLDAIRNAKPKKAVVELGFSLAIQEGRLLALFGKAQGAASIKVTLEWSEGGHKDPG